MQFYFKIYNEISTNILLDMYKSQLSRLNEIFDFIF